ncbi:MAG: GNAT family N-acetyltransferase [Dehalococcoidia bacterium]|nr:GNAT family N-acetyltransferase [Dehalococcoidia bacterium]
MKLGFLEEGQIGEALDIMLLDPFANAPLIAYLTEFKGDSWFVYARDENGLRGLVAMASNCLTPVMAVWCDDGDLLRRMLVMAASRCPRARDGFMWCLGSERTMSLLTSVVHVECVREEVQMKVALHGFSYESRDHRLAGVVPLSAENLVDLNALYELVPPETWRAEDVLRGPYRGVYEGSRLVAAAGVHWVTPWLAEIGNVAVHPDFRRRGLAEACVAAVVEELKGLTERVYLMVFADNLPALDLYDKMGFEEVQRMWLVGFRLESSSGTAARRAGRSGDLGSKTKTCGVRSIGTPTMASSD